MFEGTYTALVTPFRGGEVDYPTLAKLVERQVAAGVDGVVPCGSTGESATLSHAEHGRVVELVVEAAAGRVAVVDREYGFRMANAVEWLLARATPAWSLALHEPARIDFNQDLVVLTR